MDGPRRDASALGRALERSLDDAERRRRGRHFTAPAVAEVMAHYAVIAPPDGRPLRVLDPACGAGILLEAAARRHGATELVGVDRDPEAVATTRDALREHSALTLHRADFLDLEPTDLGGLFDAVVVNPPFLRQESIDAGRKATMRRRHSELAAPGAGRVDLLGYFLLHLTSLLATERGPDHGRRSGPGCASRPGRLAFLASAAWLTSGYGRVIRRFILAHYRVDHVIESAVEPWFSSARTRAVLVLALRTDTPDAAVATHKIHFVRLETPLVPATESATDPAGNLATGRLVAPASLAGGAPWGEPLRTPAVLEELRRRLPDAWVPLGSCATARFGLKSGADRFFVLRDGVDGHGWTWPGPPSALRPLVLSPMDLRRVDVDPATLPRQLLVLRPGDTFDPADPAVAAHIARAEAPPHELHLRPTCRAREFADGSSRWYTIDTGGPAGPAPLLWCRTGQYRHLVAANDAGALVNNNLIGLWPRAGIDAAALHASLNSAWVFLERFARGRVSNEGKIKTEVGDLPDLMVPDPALLRRAAVDVDALRGRDIGAIDGELDLPSRQAFEGAVSRAMGLTDDGEVDRWVRRLSDTVRHITALERRWERTHHEQRR